MSISAKGKFSPGTDIPDLAGKVYFITGGTAGLGAGTVKELAKHNPGHIYFTGRNTASANKLIEAVHAQSPNVPIDFISCDQTSLASVQAAVEKFIGESQRLDVLMLNAGVMALPTGLTKDGYEQQFGINVLSHALLVKLLLPTLKSTAKESGDARVISMSSYAHSIAPSRGIQLDTLKTVQDGLGGLIPGGKWARYGQSKLANMLYSDELARRHPEICSVSVHPGFVFTTLWGGLPMATKLPALISSIGKTVSPEEGHYSQTWAATCPKGKLVSGEYYVPFCTVGKRETNAAKDTDLAQRLWEWTEQELSGY